MSKTIITSITDAYDLRHEFYRAHGLEVNNDASKVVEKQEFDKQSYSENHHNAAQVIQARWKIFTRDTGLLKIHPKSAYTKKSYSTAELLTFNNNKLRKSINIEKTSAFLKFLQNPKHDAEILKDPLLPYVLTGLMTSKKINLRQYHTWKKYYATAKDFKIEKICSILDKNNNFSEEAKKYLLPILQNQGDTKHLDDEQLESFRLLIQACPKSEQTFYLTRADIFDVKNPDGSLKHELGNELRNKKIFFECDNKFSHLSASANDAFGIARYGIDEFIPQFHMHGVISKNQIEKGIAIKQRRSALHDRSIKDSERIHTITHATSCEIEEHDRYHSLVMSSIPNDILNIFDQLVKTIRNVSGQQWSREIWDFIDCDFNIFCRYYTDHTLRKISTTERTKLFFKLLYSNPNDKIFFNSVIRLIFLLDLNHNNKWQELVDINIIKNKLSIDYNKIERFEALIKNDPIDIQLFKILIFSNKSVENDSNSIMKFNQLINKHLTKIKPGIKFSKTPAGNFITAANMLTLTCYEYRINEKFINFLEEYDEILSLGFELSFDENLSENIQFFKKDSISQNEECFAMQHRSALNQS